MICKHCGDEFPANYDQTTGIVDDWDLLCPRCQDTDEEPEACPICGVYMEWEECGACDEGLIDDHDDDPVNFAEGESVYSCSECHGAGGFMVCQSLPHTDQQMAEWRAKNEKI